MALLGSHVVASQVVMELGQELNTTLGGREQSDWPYREIIAIAGGQSVLTNLSLNKHSRSSRLLGRRLVPRHCLPRLLDGPEIFLQERRREEEGKFYC